MNDLLNYALFSLGDHTIRVYSLVVFVLFVLGVFLVLTFAKKLIFRQHRIHISKKYALYNLLRYFIIVISLLAGIQILGFNLSVLLAGSAALLVGVGLGLQNLFSDFVSGIILLADSSIKVNDIIEVNGLVCSVQEIDLRTTTVLTRDDKYIIVPNTDLTKNMVINWTHTEVVSRFEVSVGVEYGSDVELVMRLMKESVTERHGILATPEPFVRFMDFGDSALMFTVLFWSDDVFRVDTVKSDIRITINRLFKEHSIGIPFPQRTIHIASDVRMNPVSE